MKENPPVHQHIEAEVVTGAAEQAEKEQQARLRAEAKGGVL